MRNILLGGLLALVVVGGFMALDKTVLHWYTEDLASEPATEERLGDRMPAALAEARVRGHLNEANPPGGFYFRVCEAKEYTESGWLVECGLQKADTGVVVGEILYLVWEDGAVTRL